MDLAKSQQLHADALTQISFYYLITIIKQALDNPSEIGLQLQAADMEMVNGKVEAAFDRLIHLVKTTVGDERNKAREHLLALFALVDSLDPRLALARSALANALF